MWVVAPYAPLIVKMPEIVRVPLFVRVTAAVPRAIDKVVPWGTTSVVPDGLVYDFVTWHVLSDQEPPRRPLQLFLVIVTV